ncbi:MAG: sugar phosphate isomerase/epimerase [Oscillospiraceae bacterium]|nr:sugar phosphate isomerase/epimerase [Oscillospiraceae bacterium]
MKFRLAAFADEADSSLDGQISAMTENGVEYLEIRGVDGENISDIKADKARDIHARLDAAGISVWSLGSPFGKIGITEDFEPHLDKFKRGLELADILGTRHIRIFSFYVPYDNAEHYSDEVMKRLEKMLVASKGSGVMLCHENEKGIYGDNAERCAEIHKIFSELRAVFDPANFVQCGQETTSAWELLSPYVEYLHIKDALADGSVVPAGKGIGNIPYILQRYRGEVLTVEPHLSVFNGLDKLERGDTAERKYCYPDSRTAFGVAVDALKKIMEEL